MAERFACLGLEEISGGGDYQHAFIDSEANETANVLAQLQGEDAAVGEEVVADLAQEHPDLDVTLGYDSDQSDNVSFCSRGVPYVFFWTEDADCYHERCDISEVVDFDGLDEVTALAGETVWALAQSSGDLAEGVAAGRNVCLAQ